MQIISRAAVRQKRRERDHGPDGGVRRGWRARRTWCGAASTSHGRRVRGGAWSSQWGAASASSSPEAATAGGSGGAPFAWIQARSCRFSYSTRTRRALRLSRLRRAGAAFVRRRAWGEGVEGRGGRAGRGGRPPGVGARRFLPGGARASGASVPSTRARVGGCARGGRPCLRAPSPSLAKTTAKEVGRGAASHVAVPGTSGRAPPVPTS